MKLRSTDMNEPASAARVVALPRADTFGRRKGDADQPTESPRTALLVCFGASLESDGLGRVLRDLDAAIDIEHVDAPQDLEAAIAAAGRIEWFVVNADNLGLAFEALAVVRKAAPAARIVVLTTTERASETDKLLAFGASAIVPRSFDAAQIRAVLALVQAGQRFRPIGPTTDASRNAYQADSVDPSVTLRECGLTEAEHAVLTLVAQGKTNLQVALRLKKKEGTVRIQMSAIMRKLKVRNRSEAIIVAMRQRSVVEAQLVSAREQPMDLSWLYPHMEYRRHRAGDVLFEKGELGNELYVLQRGCVRLDELGVEMKENDIFGELAVFAPNHLRTATATCATDVELFVLGADKVTQIHYMNPVFAMTILQLITNRLLLERQRRE